MEIQFDEDGKPYVTWDENIITLEREPVTDEDVLDKAKTELRETPEIREKALHDLRELLKGKFL